MVNEKIPEKEKFPTAEELLHNVLRSWEDSRLYAQYIMRKVNFAVGHRYDGEKEAGEWVWQDLRKAALDTFAGEGPPPGFRPEKFSLNIKANEKQLESIFNYLKQRGKTRAGYTFDHLNPFKGISNIDPILVLSWMWKSRRVFELERAAQELFSVVTFDEQFKWEEIPRIFDSFLIQLDEPIQSPADARMSVRALLVTRLATVDPASFPPDEVQITPLYLINKKVLPTLTRTEMNLVERAIKTDDFSQSDEIYKRRDDQTVAVQGEETTLFHPPFYISADEPIVAPDLSDFTNTLRKIVASACLYLDESYPAERRAQTGPAKRPGHIVTKAEDIFRIDASHVLGARGRTAGLESEGESGGTYTPRWVRGHKRRPPRSAPDAPQTVKVRPFLSGGNLLFGREALPIASRTKVT